MKTLLLRQLDVRVDRVEPKTTHGHSAEYVFALRPRHKRRSHRLDGDSFDSIPIAHEAKRTYSECRVLYEQLRSYTSLTDPNACCCALGSCPFWTLLSVLDSVAFPKRTLFNRQSPRVLQVRAGQLSALFAAVLKALRECYAPRHFREQLEAFRGAMACKVLATLCVFLELDDAEVERKLRVGDERLHGRMNLDGWQTDRQSLYFVGRDRPRALLRRRGECQRERKTSIEEGQRRSLSMSE